MKKLFITILLTVSFNSAFSQISREEITPLFADLKDENYKAAYKLSSKLLMKYDDDTSYMMGVVRYAFLYSGAAMVAKNEMKYKDLKSKASKVEGKFIAMAGHPTTADTTEKVKFNTNVLKMKDGKVMNSTMTSNANNTSIYFFEYFYFEDVFDIGEYENKNTRCSGMLDKIEFNPSESTIWIMRLHIKEANLKEL